MPCGSEFVGILLKNFILPAQPCYLLKESCQKWVWDFKVIDTLQTNIKEVPLPSWAKNIALRFCHFPKVFGNTSMNGRMPQYIIKKKPTKCDLEVIWKLPWNIVPMAWGKKKKQKNRFLIPTWHKTWDSLKPLAAMRLRSHSDPEVSA